MRPATMSDGRVFLLSCSLLLSVYFLPGADAFMPRVCLGNQTVEGGSGICCPVPRGSRVPCGGPGYGACKRVYIQSDDRPNLHVYRLDDRFNWPMKMFSTMCKCEGNFHGPDCSECYFGWSGPKCDQRKVYRRRNVLSFTPLEKARFVNIVAQMPRVKTDLVLPFEKDHTHSDPLTNATWIDLDLHYYIAAIHRYASRATLFSDGRLCKQFGYLDNNHNVIGFLTWHRYFMLIWERELRKIAIDLYGWEDFAIPYWDWIDAKDCDVCTNDLVGAQGPTVNGITLLHPQSPFANWTEYCSIPLNYGNKCYGCHTTYPNFRPLNRRYTKKEFPTTEDLDFTLSRKNYYLSGDKSCRSFREAMEGFCGRPDDKSTVLFMHNKVHNMVSGSMCCSATASNDPLFILHHGQVDRIFQLWFRYRKPKATEYPNHGTTIGNCRECNLIGFLPTVRHVDMFVDMYELGVDYDNYNFGTKGFRGEDFLKNGPAHTEEYWNQMAAAIKATKNSDAEQ